MLNQILKVKCMLDVIPKTSSSEDFFGKRSFLFLFYMLLLDYVRGWICNADQGGS